MALGKNIKKDKLIPSKPKKEEVAEDSEKAVVKKKPIKSSKKKETSKKTSVKKNTTKKKTTAKPDVAEKPVGLKPKSKRSGNAIKSVSDKEQRKEQPVKEVLALENEKVAAVPQIPSKKIRTPEEIEERRKLKEYHDLQILKLKGVEVQLIVFTLGGERYALEIDNVKEIVPSPRVSKLPHAPGFVRGVANIRGFVMVILDLEQKFELLRGTKTVSENKAYTMVIKNDRFRVGLLVDQVPNTLKLDGDQILSSAGIMSNTVLDETYIKGLINQGEEMIILLDMIELMEAEEVGAIAQEVDETN